MRVYKLSRVKSLTVTDDYFAERHLPDEQDNFTSSNEQEWILIKLRILPEMRYRLLDDFREEDIEAQPDGSFILTVMFPEDNWTYGFVLSFGEYAEVLEPEHLRNTIKEKINKISARY